MKQKTFLDKCIDVFVGSYKYAKVYDQCSESIFKVKVSSIFDPEKALICLDSARLHYGRLESISNDYSIAHREEIKKELKDLKQDINDFYDILIPRQRRTI